MSSKIKGRRTILQSLNLPHNVTRAIRHSPTRIRVVVDAENVTIQLVAQTVHLNLHDKSEPTQQWLDSLQCEHWDVIQQCELTI